MHDTRVFFVTEHYPPDIGGLENSTRYLARALHRHVPVEVLTLTPAGEHDRSDDGFAVHRFDHETGSSYARIREHIARAPARRTFACFFGFSDRWTREHFNLVATIKRVGVERAMLKVPSKGEFALYVNSDERRAAIAAVDAFVCLNDAIFDELTAGGVDPACIHRTNNGVPCDLFGPPDREQRAAARARLGLDDRVCFVFTGRFADRKRVDLLIDVFRDIDDALLLLVGEVDQRFDAGARLDQAAAEHIRLLGTRPDVRPILRAADVFVSASAAEGMPNAALEAMASGLPLLLSRIPGHVDLVTEQTGRCFDVDDAEALAANVRWFLGARDRLPDLSAHARRVAERDFDIRSTAERYLGLLFDDEVHDHAAAV